MALLSACGGVCSERRLVSLVLLEGDVAGVRVWDQRCPLLARLELQRAATVDAGELPVASVEVGAGVARVVQHGQDVLVAQRSPVQLAGVRPGVVAAGKPQPLGGEVLDDRLCGSGLLEAFVQVGDRVAHALVGVEHDLFELVVDEPDGQARAQLAASCLGE